MLPIDYEQLDRLYCIVTEDPDNSRYAVNAADLLNPDHLLPFLEAFRQQIKALDAQVAGTYFAAWWRGIAAAVQYMLSVTDAAVDLSLDNLTLHLADRGGYAQVFFRLKDARPKPWGEGNHDADRRQLLEFFYGGQLRPLFEAVSKAAGLPLGQLWGQMPQGITYYVNQIGQQVEDPMLKQRVQEDFAFLESTLEAEVFGLKLNPFQYKKREVPDPQNPGSTMLLKPTCCLAYRTDTGYGYCSSCPKLSKEQREQMFASTSN